MGGNYHHAHHDGTCLVCYNNLTNISSILLPSLNDTTHLDHGGAASSMSLVYDRAVAEVATLLANPLATTN